MWLEGNHRHIALIYKNYSPLVSTAVSPSLTSDYASFKGTYIYILFPKKK